MSRTSRLALATLCTTVFAAGCWGDITYETKKKPFEARGKKEQELLEKLGQAPAKATKKGHGAEKAAEGAEKAPAADQK